MKKFVLSVFLLVLAYTVIAQKPAQKIVSPFRASETFGWNTHNGLPYQKSFSGNYSAEVFRRPDKNHLAFLSRVKQALYIFNTLTGNKIKTVPLPFSPVDFTVWNGEYYVAGTQFLYQIDKTGKITRQWFFGDKMLFVENMKVVNGRLYLLTPDQNSWLFDAATGRFSSQNGIILNKDTFGKILKTGTHQFNITLKEKNNILTSQTFHTEKPLGTVRLIGMQKEWLFAEIQTILKEWPLKVKREIRMFHLKNNRLSPVSELEMPEMYYTYIKHDITLSDDGIEVFVSTPEKGILYDYRNLKKLKTQPHVYLPRQLYEKPYLYNNHLLPAMESVGHQMKEVQLTPITREQIIKNAEPYAPHKWYCHYANIWDRDCGGVHVKTPAWVKVGYNISVPYMWGGFSSLTQFDQGITNGVSAGDCDTHGNGAGASCAVGVDCSGFVSRAWGLGTKYSTRSIPNISTQYYSYNDLKPGDVVNYEGHHVRLIHTVYGNGSFLIIEAAASSTNWRVGYNSYSVADFQGRYLPRRYNKVIEGKPDTEVPVTSISAPKWETGDFSITFTDNDNVKVTDRYYHAGYFDGKQWTADSRHGFFKDHFGTSLSSQWTLYTGTWSLKDGTLIQSDESNSNTNAYASLTQNASKYNFLYHWKMKIGGTGDNRRAGIHFMIDIPTFSQRYNSYLVYFRVDNNTCQIYKCENNDIHLETSDACTVNAGEWFDAKVAYNAATGEIDVYKNDKLVSSWIDANPLINGKSISLRTGDANVAYKDITVYRSRGTTAEITTRKDGDVPAENPNPGQPACRILSIVADGMHNLSKIDTALINIDTTRPSGFQVFDGTGTGSDIDITRDSTRISAHWTASADPNSDIARYLCCVGTAPDSSDIVGWFDNGTNTAFTKTGLSIKTGTTCFVSVVAVNGAGLTSDTAVSNGVKVEKPTGISQIWQEKIKVYPVPARHTLWIKSEKEILKGTPELYDLTGRKLSVPVTPLSVKMWEMHLHAIPAGWYLLQFRTDEGIFRKKIIIKK
jgi:hypothetical protein